MKKLWFSMQKIFSIVLAICFIFMLAPTDAYAACSHTSLGTRYSEADHPHEYYRTCNLCGVKVYTGGNATKNHGPGTWGSGTCKYCGTHTYVPGIPQTNHPHGATGTCSCGDTVEVYTLKYTCSSCKAGSKTVSNSVNYNTKFDYLDGDNGVNTTGTIPVTFSVSYINTYNKPNTLAGGYFPNKFASSYSKASCAIEYRPPSVSINNFTTAAVLTVNYYTSGGSRISTQNMQWNNNNDAISAPGKFFILSTVPSYAIAEGVCSMGAQHTPAMPVRTNFS